MELSETQRGVLKYHYIQTRQWFDICRMVGLPVRRLVFLAKLGLAQAAIERAADKNEERRG